MKASEIYTEAAEKSLITGDGLDHLPEAFLERYSELFDIGNIRGRWSVNENDFCMNLLFCAAIAESEGD